jgi:hypothetical protein
MFRGKRFLNSRRTYATYAAGILLLLPGYHLIPDWRWSLLLIVCVGHGIDVLADILIDALRRRDTTQLILWIWIMMAAIAAPYTQLPAKLLVPAAPAMAILLVRQVQLVTPNSSRVFLGSATLVVSLLVGVLIVRAESTFAEMGRFGGRVAESQDPRVRNVWLDGAWGFQWYAQRAGARPLATTPPFPDSGDIVVAGQQAHILHQQFPRKTLIYRRVYDGHGFRVMSEGAGFFTNVIGPWPVVWGHREMGRVEVWRVDSAGLAKK